MITTDKVVSAEVDAAAAVVVSAEVVEAAGAAVDSKRSFDFTIFSSLPLFSVMGYAITPKANYFLTITFKEPIFGLLIHKPIVKRIWV